MCGSAWAPGPLCPGAGAGGGSVHVDRAQHGCPWVTSYGMRQRLAPWAEGPPLLVSPPQLAAPDPVGTQVGVSVPRPSLLRGQNSTLGPVEDRRLCRDVVIRQSPGQVHAAFTEGLRAVAAAVSGRRSPGGRGGAGQPSLLVWKGPGARPPELLLGNHAFDLRKPASVDNSQTRSWSHSRTGMRISRKYGSPGAALRCVVRVEGEGCLGNRAKRQVSAWGLGQGAGRLRPGVGRRLVKEQNC